MEIIEPGFGMFNRGFDRFTRRPDDTWCLTVCPSFVAIWDCDLTEACKGDDDFGQAGFHAPSAGHLSSGDSPFP